MENTSCYTQRESQTKYRFAVFACGPVGEMAIRLFSGNAEQLEFVLLDKADFWNWNEHLISCAKSIGDIDVKYYEDDESTYDKCRGLDAVILAYWGHIIRKPLLEMLSFGCINLHTSYLPYGKGKHPHAWAILDETPYGATIMKIDENLDTGDILYQRECKVDWTDTGKTLYFKAIKIMEELLLENKEEILSLSCSPKEQTGAGTMHWGRELEQISEIDLGKQYTGRELLNIIRAKTFSPFPKAYFRDSDTEYEVEVIIREKGNDRRKIDYEKIWGGQVVDVQMKRKIYK